VADKGAGLAALADLATPMAVRVAATLRIADHLVEGPLTADDLAALTRANADALDRLLRHLTTVDVLTRDDAGRYALTERGAGLCEDHPDRARRHWDLDGALGRADMSFVQLLHAVRTGQPAYVAHYGRSFWEDLSDSAELTASFDAIMGADVAAEAPDIVAAYDWGSLGHVVDVGGGNGSLLVALLTAYPNLRGTVLDLPRAAAAARTALAAAHLSGRAEAVAGSFFDPLPPGAGGYLLSAIIHNWNDDAARTILRRCASAAGGEGRVFVCERMGADGESPSTARDLQSLAYFGGRERGIREVTALAGLAGLSLTAVHPAGVNTILEFTQ
jgi:hypothetical protein